MAVVTIGIPVYNEEKYLTDTIRSVISQTYTDIAIIISDNCSSDNSYEIAKQYAQKDKRIQCIRHSTNMGATKNFLYTLEMCKTKYFMWLGAHDILESSFVESAVSVLNNESNVVLVYSKSILIDTNDEILDDQFYDDIDTSNLRLEDKLCKVAQNLVNCFSLHGLFRTDILKKIPIQNTISSDHTLLFCISTFGDIKLIDMYGLRCRKVREEKDFQQTIQRLANVHYIDVPNTFLPYHTPMVLNHLEYIFSKRDISLISKIKICTRVQKIFFKRFGVCWLAILGERCLLFRYIYLSRNYLITIKGKLKLVIKLVLKL